MAVTNNIPDAKRETTYNPSSSAGPFDVGFIIYTANDFEVYLDGVKTAAFTTNLGSLSSGAYLGAQITLSTATSQEVKIRSKISPSRVGDEQYSEGKGVPAADLNFAFNRVWANIRDIYDRVYTDGGGVLYGAADPLATQGFDGDFYIQTTDWEVFGPKASGVWPAGVSLKGPTGDDGPQGNAGADLGVPVAFDDSTSGDPGSGNWAVNNGTLTSATVLRVNKTDADGNSIANRLAGLVASDNTGAKAAVEFRSPTTRAKTFYCRITGGTDQTTFWDFDIQSGSIDVGTSLADGDAMAMLTVQVSNRGATGAGSGDVNGPASAVDENFARFNGTGGKTIEDSGFNAASFATSGHGHALDDLSDVNASSPTTNHVLSWDGSEWVPVAQSGGAADSINIRLSRLRIADNLTGVLYMDKLVASGFADASLVNDGPSSDYQASGGKLVPTSTLGTNLIPTMTANTSGGVTVSANSEYSASYAAWKATDGLTGTYWSTNAVVGVYEVDFGTDKKVAQVKIDPSTAGTSGAWTDFTIEGWNGSSWVVLSTITGASMTSGVFNTYDVDNIGLYDKYRINGSADDDTHTTMIRLEMIEAGTPNNMTVITNDFTAGSAPTEIKVGMIMNPVEAITLNTDLTVEVSRNGGTGYTTATLAETVELPDGTKYLEATIDVSGQLTGTNIRARIKSLNNKELEVSNFEMSWS